MAIVDIIKYEGDNTTFIWKHPSEDFNTSTQLIVHESQEAIFFLNGQALDLFGPGRHILETQNIPFLRKIANIPTGGQTPFHCEVYFINKTEQMAIKWGTDSKIQFMEPQYNFPLSIGASGEMSLRADDSRKMLVKIVGTERVLSQENLVRLFRSFLMARVKSYLAQTIKDNKLSIFEIDAHLNDLSDALKGKLANDFDGYGVALERFFVTTIVKPENEPAYEKFKDLFYRQYADVAEAELRQKVGVIDQTTEKQKTVIEAESVAQKRQIEGYTYQQERGFDVAEKVASNEGAGNFSSAGIGLGVMVGLGNTVGNAVGGAFSSAIEPVSKAVDSADKFCSNCGNSIASSDTFCDKCGTQLTQIHDGCRNCGYQFEKPGRFCPKCGTPREGKQ